MRLAAQAHERKQENDAVARLDKEVQTQAAVVEKVADTLVAVGVSDALRDRLRREEARLKDLRHALALATVPKRTVPAPKVDLEKVLAVMEKIGTVAKKAPARAREVLAGVIEPAVLTPGPDGYVIALTLKNETAALASGRPMLWKSCGGAMINFLSTADSAMIVPIRGRIHPKSIFRGLRGALLSA